MRTIFIVVLLSLVFPTLLYAKPKLHVSEKKLLHVLMKIENPDNVPNLVGDKHLKNKAIGPLQIRLPCLSDVNWIVGRKEMRRIWGKSRLNMKDMNDIKMAKWVCLTYVYYWGEIYEKRKGKKPDIVVYARIFNGGPDGWKNWKTRCYALAVKQHIKEYEKKKKS